MSVNLSIKGVPEQLAARLRARAERNHRSLQGELMVILEHAVGVEAAGAAESVSPAYEPIVRSEARARAGLLRGTKTIQQIAAEMRRLHPDPPADLPRGVDIVRQARDGR